MPRCDLKHRRPDCGSAVRGARDERRGAAACRKRFRGTTSGFECATGPACWREWRPFLGGTHRHFLGHPARRPRGRDSVPLILMIHDAPNEAMAKRAGADRAAGGREGAAGDVPGRKLRVRASKTPEFHADPLLFDSTNGQSPAGQPARGAAERAGAGPRALLARELLPRLTPEETGRVRRTALRADRLRGAAPLHGRGDRPETRWQAFAATPTTSTCRSSRIDDRVHVMRLDRGPTASFKDFAARMMARLIGRFVREDGPAADHSHRHQRRHRLGGGQRLSRRARHPRDRALSR